MQVNDVAAYSIYKAKQDVKSQINVSILKKSMELTQKMMQELQKGLQEANPKPPANPNGSISLYA